MIKTFFTALLARWRAVLFAALIVGAALAGYRYRDARADEEMEALKRANAEAVAKQALQALNIAKKQERASDDVDQRYQKRLRDLRAHYERRLRERAASPGGSVPAVPQPSGQPDAAAEELAACRADLEVLELDAAEDALQLHELQEWVREQQRIGGVK